MHEGGGVTATFPFEIWFYRYIEGVGTGVELEFVDDTFSGEYRLALYPSEKDAFLNIPGLGLTEDEQLGLTSKADRPIFNPSSQAFRRYGVQNDMFDRFMRYSDVQQPTEIKFKDLKELVGVSVSFDNLPFQIRQDYFKLDDDRVLVPITLEFQNKDLTFKEEAGQIKVASMGIYGVITGITRRIVTEFEDDLMTFQGAQLEQALSRRCMYQKIIPLDRKMRYKLEIVVKDLHSGNVGVIRRAIIPPSYDEDQLSASSLMLSDFIRNAHETDKGDEMFVLGDVWIHPSLNNVFSPAKRLGTYLEIYNAGVDQATLRPSIQATYRLILPSGQVVSQVVDENGESTHYFSDQRLVLIKKFNLKNLKPGGIPD